MATATSEVQQPGFGYRVSNTESTTSGTNMVLDQDAFLTLFMAQLQNQDPTSPMDSHEMAAQLAQFSTVEQLAQLNSNVLDLQNYLISVNNAQMAQCIGNEVVGIGDTLQVTDGQSSNASYELSEAATVTVKIYDQEGNLVRTLEAGSQEAGTYSIEWDGLDNSGSAVSDGTYTFDVMALDGTGGLVTTTTMVSGRVVGFSMEDGSSYFVLDHADGMKLPTNSVLRMYESEESAAATQEASTEEESSTDEFSLGDLLSLALTAL